MNASMFLALLAFVGAVVGACLYIIRYIRNQAKESEEFLSRLTVVNMDNSVREEYEKERRRVFNLCREGGEGISESQLKNWDPDRLEDDLSGDPANAWHRELPDNLRTMLKTALMKRTIAQFPVMATLPRELQQKAQMYQRGLIGQPQWKSILGLRDWLEEETVQIRHEAECLQEKWGFGKQSHFNSLLSEGTVFQEAAMFHKHLAKKAMDDAQEQVRRRAQGGKPVAA